MNKWTGPQVSNLTREIQRPARTEPKRSKMSSDMIQAIVRNGVHWAMKEYGMSQEDVLTTLAEHGKQPCNCCERIHSATSLSEDGICKNCVCTDCE